jgi:hypothetical protein
MLGRFGNVQAATHRTLRVVLGFEPGRAECLEVLLTVNRPSSWRSLKRSTPSGVPTRYWNSRIKTSPSRCGTFIPAHLVSRQKPY